MALSQSGFKDTRGHIPSVFFSPNRFASTMLIVVVLLVLLTGKPEGLPEKRQRFLNFPPLLTNNNRAENSPARARE
jgi:hypothetical protein